MALATLRSDTDRVVRLAEADMDRLWRLVSSGADAGEALHDLLPSIIEQYGLVGSALAAEWYDQQREKAGARGRYRAMPIEADDRGTHSLIGWAIDAAKNDATLRTLITGGAQRRVADHVRYTIASNSVTDRASRGWQRVGNGGCTNGFCDMLIARGAVYSEATATFASHDHCECSAVPAWNNEPIPVKPYTPSQKNITAADRANLRDYLASH